MPLIPYEKYVVNSRLSANELQERIAARLAVPAGQSSATFDGGGWKLGYLGKISDGTFEIRVREYVTAGDAALDAGTAMGEDGTRWGASAIIRGAIAPADSGAAVRIRMGFVTSMRVFFFGFVGFTGFCALLAVIKLVRQLAGDNPDEAEWGLLGAVALAFTGYAVMMLFYLFIRRRNRRFLADLLAQKEG